MRAKRRRKTAPSQGKSPPLNNHDGGDLVSIEERLMEEALAQDAAESGKTGLGGVILPRTIQTAVRLERQRLKNEQ